MSATELANEIHRLRTELREVTTERDALKREVQELRATLPRQRKRAPVPMRVAEALERLAACFEAIDRRRL